MKLSFVIFRIGMQRYALPLAVVERVVRMVSIVPVPETPPWLIGVIDLHGRLIPVIDLRDRLGHPVRNIHPDDRLLVLSLTERSVALAVDEASDILICPDSLEEVLPDPFRQSPYLKAIIRSEDGLILVLDPNNLWTVLKMEKMADSRNRNDYPQEETRAETGERNESSA